MVAEEKKSREAGAFEEPAVADSLADDDDDELAALLDSSDVVERSEGATFNVDSAMGDADAPPAPALVPSEESFKNDGKEGVFPNEGAMLKKPPPEVGRPNDAPKVIGIEPNVAVDPKRGISFARGAPSVSPDAPSVFVGDLSMAQHSRQTCEPC